MSKRLQSRPMNTKSRKQREIEARQNLLLDKAVELIDEQGYQNFTMDRLAQACEYSKGTVYQHFSSKEDTLSCVCIRTCGILAEFFTRAVDYPGNTRERMHAILAGHDIHARLYPLLLQNMQVIKSEAVRSKASKDTNDAVYEMEGQVFSLVEKIVEAAIESGDLPRSDKLNTREIVFGFWAMAYGAMLLTHTGIPFEDHGIRSNMRTLIQMTNVMLDGLNWKPLSNEFDYSKTHEKLAKVTFAAEIQQLKELHQSPQGTKQS